MPLLPPFDIPEGSFVLITDELAAPADFLLHQVVNGRIKDQTKTARAQGALGAVSGEMGRGAKTMVLLASDEVARWKAVASKSNVNLAQQISNGNVSFLNIPRIACEDNSASSKLVTVYQLVSKTMGTNQELGLVILDDVSTLEWIGFSPLDIIRFVRALRILCHQAKCTLLVRYHVTTPNEIDERMQQLVSICTYHLEVRPLYSGRSGAVSGEIALHRGAATRPDEVQLIRRSGSLQYRLLDTGPVYFQKGTSEGVL